MDITPSRAPRAWSRGPSRLGWMAWVGRRSGSPAGAAGKFQVSEFYAGKRKLPVTFGRGGRGWARGHGRASRLRGVPHPGLPPQAGEGAGAWLRWLPPPLAGRAGVGAGGEGAGRAPSLRAAIPPAATPPAAPASAATGRTRARGRAPPAAPRRGPASAARRPRPGTP